MQVLQSQNFNTDSLRSTIRINRNDFDCSIGLRVITFVGIFVRCRPLDEE